MAVVKRELYIPDLADIQVAFQDELAKNFQHVSVSVVECPDLRQPPFQLVTPGLCGCTKIADVGGVPNLVPQPKPEKLYDLTEVLRATEMVEGSVLGPGAASSKFIGVNSEMMANFAMANNGSMTNGSFYSKVDEKSKCHLDTYDTTQFGLMANLFISRGLPGSVIKVRAARRTGPENFISCLRKGLEAKFKPKHVAMGGVFNIESGQAKFHVMPDFPKGSFSCEADVDKWMHFYEFRAPLTVVSAFISEDMPDLGLRVEHSHGWSHHGEGGHYHYDVTPDKVSYHGFFNVAEYVYRIDKP